MGKHARRRRRVWSDNFHRTALGSNWVVLGGANVDTVGGDLRFAETNKVTARQVYYDPWQTCSDAWTLRWTQRFGALDAASLGVGVGLKNFQVFGGDVSGYNLLLAGAGTNLGRAQIESFDGSNQVTVATGPAMALSAGDHVDCCLTRAGWTITATASNRANAQVSSAGIIISDAAMLDTPVISRVCMYPLGGTVYVGNVSFAINHRKPARFILVGASSCEGWNASTADRRFISVIQSNYLEAVCNDSASYNVTSNTLSVVPKIIAHQPGTAILMLGGNDLYFNVPSNQWQGNYTNIVTQLQAAGIYVKHCLPPPRNTEDLRPLKDWILATYPSNSIIDTWTPFVTNAYSIKSAYDSGDGVHPNDAGHLLIGQIIRTNLP